MASIDAHPHLRLVGLDEARDDPAARAADEVAVENRSAARNLELEPTDPRWVLAVRAYSQLQGSAMTLDRRQRVMQTAQQLGVRPFDANLIIAVVQDHARRGQPLDAAASTISLLDPPAAASRGVDPVLLRWIAAVATAIAANSFLIWWLSG